jgi:decaprenylphospho-beta-D-ribofuranose 2-oxidase
MAGAVRRGPVAVTATREGTQGTDRLPTGWGRTAPARAGIIGPMELERLQDLAGARPGRGVLARGAGRSYRDAARNADGYVLAAARRPHIDLAAAAATARAAAATTFTELLTRIGPHGLLPPVLPGTRHLTVGGAVAAGVHGKNQCCDDSISPRIEEIELPDGTGELRRLTPGGDSAALRAAVGGMGMTGIILAVRIRLLRVRSALLQVTTRRLPDLDALPDALDGADARYSVARIDTTAAGRCFGRGILDVGDHFAAPDPADGRDGLASHDPALAGSPRFRSGRSRPGQRADSTACGSARRPGSSEVTDLAAYFRRLDAIDGWNRVMGRRAFAQYELAVPDSAQRIIAEVLPAVQRHRAPFVGTLPRLGPCSGRHLSFPLPGWSLAIDMPAGSRRLGPLLDDLDLRIASAGRARVSGQGQQAQPQRLRRDVPPASAAAGRAIAARPGRGVSLESGAHRRRLRRATSTSSFPLRASWCPGSRWSATRSRRTARRDQLHRARLDASRRGRADARPGSRHHRGALLCRRDPAAQGQFRVRGGESRPGCLRPRAGRFAARKRRTSAAGHDAVRGGNRGRGSALAERQHGLGAVRAGPAGGHAPGAAPALLARLPR